MLGKQTPLPQFLAREVVPNVNFYSDPLALSVVTNKGHCLYNRFNFKSKKNRGVVPGEVNTIKGLFLVWLYFYKLLLKVILTKVINKMLCFIYLFYLFIINKCWHFPLSACEICI